MQQGSSKDANFSPSYLRNSLHYMETESSFIFSKQPAICPNPAHALPSYFLKTILHVPPVYA